MSKLELNAPFRINRRWPDGNLKDWTIYKLRPAYENEPDDPNKVMDIYFRSEGFFVNPPSNRMETAMWNKLEKYGFEYVSESEFDDIRKEFGHKHIDHVTSNLAL